MTRTPEQIIQLLKEKLSPDLQKKVGNVLFGSNKDIAKLQKVKPPKDGSVPELDTKWEKELLRNIRFWTMKSTDPIAVFFRNNKELLKTLAKEFPLALQPPIGTQVFRGTSIKTDSLKNAFIKKQYKVLKVGGREVFHFKNLEYNPARDSQSWTTNPKVAFKFNGNADYTSTIHVVYSTKVDKDFLFNPELMDIVFNGKESETVRIEKKGTFEAFVDSGVFLTSWKLEPIDSFIHKLTKAKPFFEPIIIKYNKLAARENKQWSDEEQIMLVSSIVEIIDAVEEDRAPVGFVGIWSKSYRKATQDFIKSVKDR